MKMKIFPLAREYYFGQNDFHLSKNDIHRGWKKDDKNIENMKEFHWEFTEIFQKAMNSK